MSAKQKIPKSVSNPIVVFIGFISLVASFLLLKNNQLFSDDIVKAALFSIVFTASIVFILDLVWQKVHLRSSTGLDFKYFSPSLSRSLIKLFGLLGTIGFVGLFYFLFPEYSGNFYLDYWRMLQFVFPIWFLLAIPYFYFIDARMTTPEDGYWQMGQMIALNWEKVNTKLLVQHLLGWLVKGYFLPLMFTYFCRDLRSFILFDFSSITNFKVFFDFTYNSIFLVDVGIVSIGYIFSLKLFDTHIRSAEPTVLGWIVALICYEPFWSLIGTNYLNYSGHSGWGAWLQEWPLIYYIWGSAILILFFIYVWSSIMFGCRFSNLTHRGIITNGPYIFTKHPAYVAKNVAWWLVSVPFIAQEGTIVALKRCILLFMLNVVYYLRAKTEEKHLSQDTNYVQYASWINDNGIFNKISQIKIFNFLYYQKPN